MAKKHEPSDTCGIIRVELEIPIQATAARVWKTLTQDASRWWHKDFYTSPTAKGFVIEPRVGGRMYEDWGDGGGCLWATIIVFEPGRVLECAGDLSPTFGGPARSLVRFELVERGQSTCLLKISDAVFGRVDEGTASSLDSGWRLLFGELKKMAERG